MSDFSFQLSERLDSLHTTSPEFKTLYLKFQAYKTNSDPKEFAAPTRHTQEEWISTFPELFGRDRFFKNPADAKKEDLIHVHVWTPDMDWIDPADGDYKVQWECKSNAYLVYSYFKFKGKHHFYLIAFLDKRAHQLTKDLPDSSPNPVVLEWLSEAKVYRESLTETANET